MLHTHQVAGSSPALGTMTKFDENMDKLNRYAIAYEVINELLERTDIKAGYQNQIVSIKNILANDIVSIVIHGKESKESREEL